MVATGNSEKKNNLPQIVQSVKRQTPGATKKLLSYVCISVQAQDGERAVQHA